MSLTFAQLRTANMARMPLFKNHLGGLSHSEPDGSDWSPADWLVAVASEVGEALNVIKKIRRGDFATPQEGRALLGEELADVVTYADILSFQMGEEFPGDFETLRKVVNDSSPVNRPANLELMVAVGRLAAKISRDAIPVEAHIILGAVVFCVDIIATQNNIDLGRAVRNKFNAVSRRIDCQVFL